MAPLSIPALSSAQKDLVFLTDSDRQFDLNDLHRLMPLIAQADLVAGYRAPRRDPFMRVLNGVGWSALVTLLFGYTARDIDCAFKLFRARDFASTLIWSRAARPSAPSFWCVPSAPAIAS